MGLEIPGFVDKLGKKKNMDTFECLDVILGVLGVRDVLGVYSYGLFLLRRFAQLHLSSEIGPFEGLTWNASKSGIGLKMSKIMKNHENPIVFFTISGVILVVWCSYSTKLFRNHSPPILRV